MVGKRKKRFTGEVLRDKNDKTIVIGVVWLQRDRIYKKAQRRLTKLVAHDEGNRARIGDKVMIEETRPTSATKRWRLVDILDAQGKVTPKDDTATKGTGE